MADSADLIVQRLCEFRHRPLDHARYVYPWRTTALPAHGPRQWQADVLTDIGDALADPNRRYNPIRIAVASGHGVGKSGLIAMVTKWAMDCYVGARIVITANTEGQLLTKTGPEIAKWASLALTAEMTKVNATSLVSAAKGHEKNWRTDLVTWSVNNTEAFAGLHNEGRIIVMIYDEASGIDDRVWDVTLGALTDENTIIIWLVFGNPTKNTGRFRECFGKHRNLWLTRQIDSRTVEGTNKTYLDEMVRTYGENSDIVKVRVRGMFPSASSMQFIGTDLAQVARVLAVPPGLPSDPIIFGVDCARFGDDKSVLAIRRGRDARSIPWKRWHHMDSMTVAGDIALQAQRWKPDAIFVDVGSIGGAVIDRLRQLKLDNVFEVNFGGSGGTVEWDAGMHVKTANKRAEIWTSMRSWLMRGGVIPDEQTIEDDLTGVEYTYGDGETSIMLEKKAHMKGRGLASPDDGDALACTFAMPVSPRLPRYRDPASYIESHNHYDRYAELQG